jgi:hypothetical protein
MSEARSFDFADRSSAILRNPQALFTDRPRIAPDPRHSAEEDRLIAVGRTKTGRPVFVAFTFRTKDKRRLIRPVPARYMHAKEIEAYEKESSAT